MDPEKHPQDGDGNTRSMSDANAAPPSPAIITGGSKVDINFDAKRAADQERSMTLMQAIKLYPKAVGWSVLLSTTLIMEGYDLALLGSLWGSPEFGKKYGSLTPEGKWQVSASWQSALSNGARAGEVIGLLINGVVSERYGYRKTMVGSLISMIGFVFILFFAPNVQTLVIGEVFCGIPWGIFQTLSTAYASEVCPVVLRPYLTTFVNMCWVIGQFFAAGVNRASVERPDQWAYRIPFAVQWVWPVPILLGCLFAPDSPWWHVRQGDRAGARKALQRLTSRKDPTFNPDETIAMIEHTNELEKSISAGTSYWDCFRRTNLRRTEIVCGVWLSQTLCGTNLMGYFAYFCIQAGLPTVHSFDMSLGQYALGLIGTIGSWFIMTKVGRRTIFFSGMCGLFVLLIITGSLSFAPPTDNAAKWAIGAMLIVFTFLYDFTIGPVTYSLVSEISSTRLKAKTIVIARALYNISNIVINVLTNYQLSSTAWDWGARTAYFWAGTCLVCTIWVYFRLPEPKGRTYGELDLLFEHKVSARRFKETKVDPYAQGLSKEPSLSRPLEFSRSPGLLPLELVDACIDTFIMHLETTIPILHREQLQLDVSRMNESTEAYCLVATMCAFVIIQTGAVRPPVSSLDGDPLVADLAYGQRLLDEALEARKYLDILSRPSCRIIIITFFLYCCHVGLNHQKQGWFFLREATTLYMSGPVELDSDMDSAANALVPNRLFWLLLISERAHAIRRRRPITLQITPESPATDGQANEGLAVSGFGYLANLFRPFDETFLSLWNRTHSVCSAGSLVNLEAHIQEAVPPSLDIYDDQLANLRITQQWLRTIIWQLSTTLGFLSSNSVHECMTFRYPLQIARDLAVATWKLPQLSMEVHGMGLVRFSHSPLLFIMYYILRVHQRAIQIEKVFEVACTLTDVISCIPSTETKSSGFELGPQDYLIHFFSLIIKLRGGKNRFLPLLMSKVSQTLPAMVTPISRHLDIPFEQVASGSGELLGASPTTIGLYDKQVSDLRLSMSVESSREGTEMPGPAVLGGGESVKVIGFKLPETGHGFSLSG
ncbi:hypothetical protein FQN53_002340, partial [Emmonsiellopsis sp. PD_33]